MGLRLCSAVVAATIALAVPGTARAGQPGVAEILIRNATIYTVTKGRIENGSILMRDGKIVAVGKNLKVSPNAVVVDATGKFVTPGIIDCHSHIAIDGNVNESSLSVTSMVRISDVIDPEDPTILYGLSGGVTVANVLHGSANAIGGQNAVIKLRWGRPASALVFKQAPPGIKFALGENPKRSNFPSNPPRYPRTRMGVADVIRDAFVRAIDYRETWRRYEADLKAGKKDLMPPARDLELEPLVEVLEGKRLVHAHCYRADEIAMILKLAKDFNFRIATLQHVLEGYKVAREIAAAGAGASTFADQWAYKVEAFDATPYNVMLMHRAGVLVSINSDDAERQRRLNTDAARMVRYGGVTKDEALAMITINPARQLGIDQWVGSIEEGKDADVVIWSAEPLSAFAIAERVYVDGIQTFDRQEALQRADEAQREIERLRERERLESKKPATPPPAVPRQPGPGAAREDQP